jgi:hypothetical protein
MKALLPCSRSHQLSFISSSQPGPKRHRWKNKICIHCGIKKSEAVVYVCDCGCGTAIFPDTLTTHYGKLNFIFSHETLNLFDELKIVSSEVLKTKIKNKKKSKEKNRKRNKQKQLLVS